MTADQVFQQITLKPEQWTRVIETLRGSTLNATGDELRAFMRPLREAKIQSVTEDDADLVIVTLPKGIWGVVRATLGALKWQAPMAEITDFLDALEDAPVNTIQKD